MKLATGITIALLFACAGSNAAEPGNDVAPKIQLLTLDPGHFHAALVQKVMYPEVSPLVHVYAPRGSDLDEHLARLDGFNARPTQPTHWQEKIYAGPDFLERMVQEKPGNVVVISGNNTRKTEYILRSVTAGLNVLADKPMAITPVDFQTLRRAMAIASGKKLLVGDIMTERYEIATILQRELAGLPEVFGVLQPGSLEEPAVVMESVHYFLKEVAGKPLRRPAWFFDVRQEGEAIPDVGTHLMDLAQWECFPDQALDWQQDIKVERAQRWPTSIDLPQFQRLTGCSTFPAFLAKDVDASGRLEVFANGEVEYRLRNIHVKLTALWKFEPPPGGQDTHYSVLRGTRATLIIRQGPEEHHKPVLYVETSEPASATDFEQKLRAAVTRLAERFPELRLERAGVAWKVVIPDRYHVGHEAHFAQVTERFLRGLAKEDLPDSELPNILAKYYTTTEAYRLSHSAR